MRSNSASTKFLSFCAVVALVLIALAGTGFGKQSAANAATMNATMSGMMSGTMSADGPYPPCPPIAASMMMGTEPAMMGTKDAMMMGTKPAMMGTMGAMSMATQPAMMGTMDAMSEMMTNACHFYAQLAGDNEAPTKGDPKGKGTAEINISRPATGPGEVCFIIKAEGIKLPAAAAHIHKGAKGVAGPVVVPLSPAPDAKGMSQGCTQKVDRALIADIVTNPGNYYVNVHNADFPNGAMRGQLEPAEMSGK